MKGFKGYINLAVGCLAFIGFLLLNLISVKFGPQTFLDVLLNSGLMMLCWLLVRNAFAEQGIISGQKDESVKATKKEHLITSNEIAAYKSDFCIWCEKKNADRLKDKRIAILTKSSLVYRDYFDEQGNFLDKEVPIPDTVPIKKQNRLNKKRYKADCKALKKARFAFVPPYEPEEITAKDDVTSGKRVFGVSIKHWKNIKIISSVIVSLVIFIGLSFMKVGSKTLGQTDIMILVFEIMIMGASALMFYFSSSNFICGDWREGLIKKTRVMEEFYRSVVGTITYENDVRNADGTITVGKKIFTKSPNYKSLAQPKEKDEKQGKENQETNQAKDERPVGVAKEECAKQRDDTLGADSRSNLLESSDNMFNPGTDNKSVVLDSDNSDNSVLGRSVYTGNTITDRTSVGVESDTHEDKETQVKEEREGGGE